MRQVDAAIIGAGSAGLTALGLIKKQTDNYVLINEGWYGTTCAKVGCMPSKVLIQIADDFDRLQKLAVQGIEGIEQAHVNGETVMKRVQTMRDAFVEKNHCPLAATSSGEKLKWPRSLCGCEYLRNQLREWSY